MVQLSAREERALIEISNKALIVENEYAIARALTDIYGIPALDAQSHVAMFLRGSRTLDDISESIRRVHAEPGHRSLAELDGCIAKVSAYDSLQQRIFSSTAASTMAKMEISLDRISAAVSAQIPLIQRKADEAVARSLPKRLRGHRFGVQLGSTQENLEFILAHASIYLVEEARGWNGETTVEIARGFCDNVREFCADASPYAASRFINDVLTALAIKHPQKKGSLEWYSQFMLYPLDATDAMNPLVEIEDAYNRILSGVDLAILSLLEHGREPKEFLPGSTATIATLRGHGADLTALAALLKSTDDAQHDAIMTLAGDVPDVVMTYKRLRNTRFDMQAFFNYITSPMEGWERTFRGNLLSLPKQFADNVSYGVRHATDVAMSPARETLAEFLLSSPSAASILPQYFDEIAHGNQNRAEALLMLRYAQNVNLRALAGNIRSTPDASLGWVRESHIDELVQRLSRTKTGERKRRKDAWLDDAGRYCDEDLLSRTYDALDKDTRNRMRAIARSQPETLPQFCADVLDTCTMFGYRILFSDPQLFDAYAERLKDGTSGAVVSVLKQDSPKVYGDLTDLLLPTEDSRELLVSEEPETKIFDPTKYSRIVVWGARYGEDETRRLQDVFPVPVELYGTRSRAVRGRGRKYITDVVNEDDLVVVLTGNISHTDIYYPLSKRCKAVGAQMLHFNQDNVGLLIDMINEFS